MIDLEDDIFQAHCQIDYLRDHIENGGRISVSGHAVTSTDGPLRLPPPQTN